MVTSEGKRDFDAAAKTWDQEPRHLELARAIAAAIRAAVPVDRNMEAMDYGCGTGLVTLTMQPHLGHILAVDASAGMLEVLGEKIQAAGIDNVTPLQLDLTKDDLPRRDFQLIFSSMALHHIDEPGPLIEKFATVLAAGGYLCIADLDAEDGSFHGGRTVVEHNGFSAEDMQAYYRVAGLTGLKTIPAHKMSRPIADGTVKQFQVLLTVGRKGQERVNA